MERDVKVNTELYQSLLNNALQLRLVKEGKVGNVRVLDEADAAALSRSSRTARSSWRRRWRWACSSASLRAFLRNAFVERRLRDPHEVEADTGLPVFSTIPLSRSQDAIAKRRLSGATGVQAAGDRASGRPRRRKPAQPAHRDAVRDAGVARTTAC